MCARIWLIILLLPLDLVMQTDIAHRRAELRGEHEEDLCLAPPVRTADDSLAEVRIPTSSPRAIRGIATTAAAA